MLTLEPPCTAAELATLRAFRRVAKDVHRIFGPLANHSLTLDLRDPGSPRLDSFPEDSLRSLAMAVRQAYMQKEITHFAKVRKILKRATDPDVREYLEVLRSNWNFALVSPMGLGIGDKTYGGKQVFETWLYGRAIHRHAEPEADAQILDQMDSLLLPTHVVQCVIRDLATCILQLDFAVADALDEEPLEDFRRDLVSERPFSFKISDPAT